MIQAGAAAIEIGMIKIQRFRQHPAQNIQLEVAQVATHGQARPKVTPSPNQTGFWICYVISYLNLVQFTLNNISVLLLGNKDTGNAGQSSKTTKSTELIGSKDSLKDTSPSKGKFKILKKGDVLLIFLLVNFSKTFLTFMDFNCYFSKKCNRQKDIRVKACYLPEKF